MKANRWLPILVGTWGSVTTMTGLVDNFSGLVAIRFFLGFCEGGLLPGIVSPAWHLECSNTPHIYADFVPQHPV